MAKATEEGQRLLLDVLTLFNNPDGVDTSRTLLFKTYYFMICIAARELKALLKDRDISAPQYALILGRVLNLFESFVKPDVLSLSNSFLQIHDCRYERLPALRSRMQAVNSISESFFDLQSSLHFGDQEEECQEKYKELILCTITFNDELQKSIPAYEVRKHATTLYETLSEKLGCGEGDHEAKLCLARYESSEELETEISFDILFSTHTTRWQESKIGVIVQRNQSTSRTLREITEKICSLIERAAKLREHLYMLVDQNRKFYLGRLDTHRKRALNNSISMKAIIEDLEVKRITATHYKNNAILSRKHKRIIAVILAHALIHYCGSAWLSEHWDKNHISFLRHSSGDRLVLSTNLKPHNPEPEPDAELQMHSYPGILALAILMLEMELDKTIERARGESEGEESIDDDESTMNTDLDVALFMLEDKEIQEDTTPGFRAAVKACLLFSHCNKDIELDALTNDREKLYDDIALRQKIYHEIIMPLEKELYSSFLDLNLDETLRFAFLDRVKVPSQPTDQHRENPVSTRSNIISKQSHNIGTSTITTIPVSDDIKPPTCHQVFFHDVPVDERQVIRFSQFRLELEMLTIFSKREDSKSWMKRYMSARDSLIARIDHSNKFETSRVKVAVLDTGIDWKHPFIRGAKDRIVEWKNWANDRKGQDSQRQVHDDIGHGTHVTALLLKTAPEAKIYVSRVVGRNGSMIAVEKIAKAIDHAVNTWKVDIITMSFGFRILIAVIDEAIKKACSDNVIMFAATSNDGGNEEIAFPASAHTHVIGIISTDAKGNKSNFSPKPLPYIGDFGILGEVVESSWPMHLKQGLFQCRSGTSYATPIAAGTAATMLFYVRMKVENQERVKRFATREGMRLLLQSMAGPMDGYYYLRPWVLWEQDEEYILAKIRTAFL